jgi:hypothetical protein
MMRRTAKILLLIVALGMATTVAFADGSDPMPLCRPGPRCPK